MPRGRRTFWPCRMHWRRAPLHSPHLGAKVAGKLEVILAAKPVAKAEERVAKTQQQPHHRLRKHMRHVQAVAQPSTLAAIVLIAGMCAAVARKLVTPRQSVGPQSDQTVPCRTSRHLNRRRTTRRHPRRDRPHHRGGAPSAYERTRQAASAATRSAKAHAQPHSSRRKQHPKRRLCTPRGRRRSSTLWTRRKHSHLRRRGWTGTSNSVYVLTSNR